jgi:hypothetical protein
MGWDGILGAGWRKPETKHATQPVRQPAALQRNDATAASSPPAASPQVKHAPAAGPGHTGCPDPIVRTSPEKYGRAIAPDATQGTGCPRLPAAAEVPSKAHDVVLGGGPGEVVVKSHLRGAPAVPAQEPEVTADFIVEEVGKRNRRNTRDSLSIGRWVYKFILNQPERAPDAQFGRQGALEHLREKFLAARYDGACCRVDRDLRCYHLVTEFGGDAKGVNISVIRTMTPLLEKEQAKERPKLKAAYAESAKILWIRAVNEKLSAAAVRIEVLKILPAKRPRDDRQQKSRQAVTVLRLIPMLSAEERRQAMRALREADAAAKSQPAAAIAG